MLDPFSNKPEEIQKENIVIDREKISKIEEGHLLEHNMRFLLTHYEEMNYHLYKNPNYKVKEIVSLVLGKRFLDLHK